jgi:hypothetical protein
MARANTVATGWKILVPEVTVIFTMAKVFPRSNFTAGGGFMPFGIKGVFIAIPLGIVFALEGFEQAAQLAGEARKPKRDAARDSPRKGHGRHGTRHPHCPPPRSAEGLGADALALRLLNPVNGRASQSREYVDLLLRE